MRWARHVAHTGGTRNAYRILDGNLKERDHSEDLGVDGRTILEWILRKQAWGVQTGFIWLRIGTSGGLL
jgi:hypothetical protein